MAEFHAAMSNSEGDDFLEDKGPFVLWSKRAPDFSVQLWFRFPDNSTREVVLLAEELVEVIGKFAERVEELNHG